MNAALILAASLCLGQVVSGEPTPATPPKDEAAPERFQPVTGATQLQPVQPLDQQPAVKKATLETAAATDQPTRQPPSTSALLRDALETPEHGALSGNPVTLVDALAGTADRRRQLQVVTTYWNLSIRIARYHFALDRFERLARIPLPTPAADRAVLNAAQSEAKAQLRDAELAAVVSQYELAELSPQAHVDPPPLPLDRPFVGLYRTNFQSLFADRTAPSPLRRIDRTLPLSLALIDARASAVVAAEDALSALDRSYREGQTVVQTLLESHAELTQRQEAFLTAVGDYNGQIAVYALSVAGTNVDGETLVSMLIETTPQTHSVLVPNRKVVPASAVAPLAEPPAASAPQTAPVADRTEPSDAASDTPRTQLEEVPADTRDVKTPVTEQSVLKSIRRIEERFPH